MNHHRSPVPKSPEKRTKDL